MDACRLEAKAMNNKLTVAQQRCYSRPQKEGPVYISGVGVWIVRHNGRTVELPDQQKWLTFTTVIDAEIAYRDILRGKAVRYTPPKRRRK